MKNRYARNLTTRSFPKLLRLNMQNNSRPWEIKALLVRVHPTSSNTTMQQRKESWGAICPECIVVGFAALSLIFRYQMRPRDHANSISLFGGRPQLIVRRGWQRAQSVQATAHPQLLPCNISICFPSVERHRDVARRVSSYQPSLLLSAARCKLASQARFSRETSLILKSKNFFTIIYTYIMYLQHMQYIWMKHNSWKENDGACNVTKRYVLI